jgi:hypothetical protein
MSGYWTSIVLCPDGFVGYVIEESSTHVKVYNHPQGRNYGTTNRGRTIQKTAKAFPKTQVRKLRKDEYRVISMRPVTRYEMVS